MKKSIFSIIQMILFSCIYLNAQEMNISPMINYITPTSQTGEIFLNVSGGTEPYTYEWTKNNQPYEGFSNNLSGLGQGTYRVTITDANSIKRRGIFYLYKKGVWENTENLEINGNVYSKSTDVESKYGVAISNNTTERANWRFLEFKILDVESTTTLGYVHLGKMPSSSKDILYGFRLHGDVKKTLEIIENGIVQARTTYANGDRLVIVFNGTEHRLYYSKNGKKIIRRKIEDDFPLMNVSTLVEEGPGVSLEWITNLKYKDMLLSKNYVVLEKKLDGSYARPLNNNLLFTYTERYATDNNDSIICKIYDWKRTVVADFIKQNHYGVNWQDFDLSGLSNLISGDFYTLEVTGVNKDEIYYIRFLK